MSQRMLRRAGVASAAVTVLVLSGVSAPAAAAAAAMTLSSVSGPSGGGNTITGTVAASAMSFPAGTSPTVQFQYVGTGAASCSTSAKDVAQIVATGTTTTAGVLTADPDTVRRIATAKIVFKVPSSAYPALDDDGNPSTVNPGGLVLAGTQTSARWNVCVYDSASTTSGTLLAAASYTLVVPPTITSIIPVSSPAGGGQSITVNGTGFGSGSTAISGSIGGAALTDIKVAPDGASFTATTGPRAAESGLALTVITQGGTVSSLDPDNNGLPQDGDSTTNDAPIPFTYSNGITVTPNTAASGTAVTLDVNGAGFSQLTFDSGGTPTSTQAHVFLVKDAYVAASNRGVAECDVLAVVSDTELICTLDLSADQLSPADSTVVPSTPIADGAYIVTVVADGATDAGSDADPTIISSGAAFIVAPY
jgi:hypothetical protein